MAKVLGWLKSATARLLDPNRETLLAAWTERIERQLFQQRREFDLERATAELAIPAEDIRLVAERVYEQSVQRAWKDQAVSAKEREALEFIAGRLHLSEEQVRKITLRAGLPVFETVLGQSLADGALDRREAERLSTVAASLGMTMRQLMLGYFRTQGESLLRSLFTAAAEDGRITEEEWSRLSAVARSLGLEENDLRRAIEAQAEPFVEHVLADAKADERLSDAERRMLKWLLSEFPLSPAVQDYVESEMRTLELFTGIAEGRLPSLVAEGVALRSGEIAHFQGSATYVQPKSRKDGPHYEHHDGVVTITDYRLLFASSVKTFEVTHRKVVSLTPIQHGLELLSSGRGTGLYRFGSDAKLATAVYRTAVAKANQTLVEKSEGLPNRHIPRDVRQRVWQRYGGRCAECGATQYLEFDHIVPVAKGGSSTDLNVQLLCRGCNGKKADLI